jgi:cobalt-precorrin 5A hydrolase
LLSGHIGGGNKLAQHVAESCRGTAVITTASDISGHTAVDLWSIENGLSIINPERLAAISVRLLNKGTLAIYQDSSYGIPFPEDFTLSENRSQADIIISMIPDRKSSMLQLVPRINFIGFGCRRGASVEEFEHAVADIKEITGIPLESVAAIASIDLKKDEPGLREFAVLRKWPIRFFSKEELNAIQSPSASTKVFEKIGAWGVCEPAAMLAASTRGKQGHLIIGKMTWEKITAAIAQKAH